jgi:hypothetical protein
MPDLVAPEAIVARAELAGAYVETGEQGSLSDKIVSDKMPADPVFVDSKTADGGFIGEGEGVVPGDVTAIFADLGDLEDSEWEELQKSVHHEIGLAHQDDVVNDAVNDADKHAFQIGAAAAVPNDAGNAIPDQDCAGGPGAADPVGGTADTDRLCLGCAAGSFLQTGVARQILGTEFATQKTLAADARNLALLATARLAFEGGLLAFATAEHPRRQECMITEKKYGALFAQKLRDMWKNDKKAAKNAAKKAANLKKNVNNADKPEG